MLEEELNEGIIMKLLDHNIENRPAPKGNSCFIRKKEYSNRRYFGQQNPANNECELVSDTDQQFNDITLKSQNTPVIKYLQYAIPHGRCTK